MANKKLSYDQIAERNLFDPLKKEIEEVDKMLKSMSELLKLTVEQSAKLASETPLKGYKNISQVEKALGELEKATADLSKLEKERARLAERLAGLDTDQAKANAALKVEIQEKNRALKQEAILQSESIGAYRKASAELTKLRKEYKDLALQNKENTKEGKELLANIQALDKRLKDVDESVGQYQRSVGNYEKAVNGLRRSFNRLATATGVVKLLQLVADAFQQNRETSDLLAKGFGRITVAISVFVQRVARVGPAIANVFEQISIKVERFFLNIRRGFADLPELFGGSTDRVEELDRKISDLDRRAQALAGGGVDTLTSAFSGMREEIADLIKANDRLIDDTTRFQIRANSLNRELADLIEKQGLLEAAANDSTLGMRSQREAAESLLQINAEVAAKNEEIARNELALARQRANIRRGDLDAQTAYAEAYVNYQQTVAESVLARSEVENLQREQAREQTEADLDRLFDISDRAKTIAEQRVNDERLSLESRKAAVEQATDDITASYQEIEDEINASLLRSFEARKALAEKTGEEFNEAFQGIDIDALLALEDTTEINEALAGLDIDETIGNRLREALIERLQAVEDLAVAQRDLNDVQQEYNRITADIAIQEQLLADIQSGRIGGAMVLEKLEDARTEATIERLRMEIAAAEEGSTRRAELSQELNDLLLAQELERIEKENEARDKQRRKDKELMKEQEKAEADLQGQRIDRAREAFELLDSLAAGYYEKQIDAIDEQIDKSRERESQLRDAAQQGIQDAEANLAREIQQQEEAERRKAEVQRRQELAELAIVALRTYAAKLSALEPGQDSRRALTSTFADIAVLQSFIQALPGFFEGAERVGDELSPLLPGRDGHIIRVDGDERILNPAHSAMIPRRMSNLEVAQAARAADRLQAASVVSPVSVDLDPLREGLRQVQKAVEGIEVYKGMDFDRQREAVTFSVEKKGRRERKHRRIGGVFGS